MIIENSHDLSRNWLLRNFYQKMLTTALILAGHGSHISPHTAGLIWRHVDRLRAMGIADEVTAAFWKEMPSFHTVLNSVSAQDITIVPMFTARGYFTQTVIPAEMGLEGAVTQRDGRVIRYTRTLGEHPYLSTVVQLRVETAIQTFALPRDQTAVAIIGHSTRRNPESRQATETQAQNLRDLNCVAQVQAPISSRRGHIRPLMCQKPFCLKRAKHGEASTDARSITPLPLASMMICST